jgi:nucleotide-binding universal stress UspA family protein
VGVRLLHAYLLPGFSFRGAAWMLGPEEIADVGAEAKVTLAAKAEGLRAAHPGVAIHTTLVQTRKPAEAILQAVDEIKPSLVVMGTHGRGFWSRAMLGSTTREVVRRATRPVLTVHAATGDSVEGEAVRQFSLEKSTILIPIEFDEVSLHALDFGIALAKRLAWAVRVLHTFHTPDSHGQHHDRQISLWRDAAERTLGRLLEERRDHGVPIEARVFAGSAVRCILEQAREADIGLIAMATHGRAALAEALLGEVAQEIVRLAPCPVMTCAGGASAQA